MNDHPDPKYEPLDLMLVARHRFGGYPPLGDWQMGRALARRHRVLYVDPPDIRLSRNRTRRPPEGVSLLHPEVRQAAETMWVARPTVLPGAGRAGTAGLSDALLSHQLNDVAAQVFAASPVVVSFDPARGGLRGVRRSLLAYWRRDSFADHLGLRARWLGRREARVLQAANVVSCVSQPLVDDTRGRGHSSVHLIPNGCDAAHFAVARQRPPSLPDTPVTLGFVGGLWWRLDAPLIRGVAKLRPDWAIVLVGGEDHLGIDEPNVHRFPFVDYADIPAWMQHFDVGFVPYATTLDFNRASFPLKAFEFLAAGVPVVGTSLPAFSGLEPFVRSADTPEEVVGAVEEALRDGPDPERCRAEAARNTWDERAERLTRVLAAGLSACTRC
jgi:teichuronic acid biosynthesis glycosyltransferase TuaH